MTAILATSRWMCADRRITDGEELSSLVKIAKNPHLIAAASGNATSTLAVKRAIKKGARSAADLIEHVDKDSYALVLNPEGRLWRVQDGAVWEEKEPAAIGSGGDLVLGFFLGAGGQDWYSQDVARRAQAFAAKRRVDCGGGCDFRSFR